MRRVQVVGPAQPAAQSAQRLGSRTNAGTADAKAQEDRGQPVVQRFGERVLETGMMRFVPDTGSEFANPLKKIVS
jgi:hypothetical protein